MNLPLLSSINRLDKDKELIIFEIIIFSHFSKDDDDDDQTEMQRKVEDEIKDAIENSEEANSEAVTTSAVPEADSTASATGDTLKADKSKKKNNLKKKK